MLALTLAPLVLKDPVEVNQIFSPQTPRRKTGPMKASFATLTAAVALTTTVSMVDHLKNGTTAGSILPRTAVHTATRQWGVLRSAPARLAAETFRGVLGGFVQGVALFDTATDGDPHATEKWFRR
jgi:hypothetical protein